MTKKRIESIPLENLLIDLRNPRYDPRTSQREALITIAQAQGVKLFNLADDIIEKGLNPSELPIVSTTKEKGIFTVMEGNRRVAALKVVASSTLLDSLGLPPNLYKRFKALQKRAGDDIPQQLDCVILSREDAEYWILIKHTGENEGVGVVGWDRTSQQRFRGSSPALQAIDQVEKGGYLDDETKKKLPKIAISNIERILSTPDARKYLGVDVKTNQLILNSPEEQALGRLAIIIRDVANRDIKVSDLDFKQQRVDYAQKVASVPLLPSGSQSSSAGGSGSSSTTGQPGTPPRRINPQRYTLIPKQLRLAIPQARINRIYSELQKLNVEQFINSCAVMFRVFVELSMDDFAQRKKISLKVPKKKAAAKASNRTQPGPPQMRDMNLREKIKAVYGYLEANGICTKDELRGIKALYANREHVLSVDSLNAYVHNKNYNPGPSDLKASWDNIQIVIERIWAK